MTSPIYELAIVGRITWDLHSLNNEGSIGNVTEPRTVMLANGEKSDGVSGEMLKHAHVQALWQIGQGSLPLCSNCQKLEPNKANKSEGLGDKMPEAEAMATAISRCALCDLHGFLVEKPTINRSSCLEFGWAVGVPENWHRDLHLHARHAVGERGKPSKDSKAAKPDDTAHASAQTALLPGMEGGAADAQGSATESDTAPTASGAAAGTSQMVYNRPTRSGVYAVVTVFSPWRIGLEHLHYTYPIDEPERLKRYQAAMRAYQAVFWRTDGAMTTTRLPHVEGFEGNVVVSRTNLPVPVVSSLNGEYDRELCSLVETIGDGLENHRFANMAEFVKLMSDLSKDGVPYTLGKEG